MAVGGDDETPGERANGDERKHRREVVEAGNPKPRNRACSI